VATRTARSTQRRTRSREAAQLVLDKDGDPDEVAASVLIVVDDTIAQFEGILERARSTPGSPP
jgi:hypothetical protein